MMQRRSGSLLLESLIALAVTGIIATTTLSIYATSLQYIQSLEKEYQTFTAAKKHLLYRLTAPAVEITQLSSEKFREIIADPEDIKKLKLYPRLQLLHIMPEHYKRSVTAPLVTGFIIQEHP